MERLNWGDLATLHQAAERLKGQVDVLAIDPPFNTGSFQFEDEGDSHQIWAAYMRERLIAIKPMLKEDAFLFIAIDDREFAQLKLLCDEIFGESRFKKLLETRPRPHFWKTGVNTGRCFHQYILCYCLDESLFFEPTVKGRLDQVMDYLIAEQQAVKEDAVMVKASRI